MTADRAALHEWMEREGITDATMIATAIETLTDATLAAAEQSKAIADQAYLANLLNYADVRAMSARTPEGARVWEQIELGLGLNTPSAEPVQQAAQERITFAVASAAPLPTHRRRLP